MIFLLILKYLYKIKLTFQIIKLINSLCIWCYRLDTEIITYHAQLNRTWLFSVVQLDCVFGEKDFDLETITTVSEVWEYHPTILFLNFIKR